MEHVRPSGWWSVIANESITLLDGDRHLHFRIYNRGLGAVAVFDRHRKEIACLVGGNCLDFEGDFFAILGIGPEPANGLCAPIKLSSSGRPKD